MLYVCTYLCRSRLVSDGTDSKFVSSPNRNENTVKAEIIQIEIIDRHKWLPKNELLSLERLAVTIRTVHLFDGKMEIVS